MKPLILSALLCIPPVVMANDDMNIEYSLMQGIRQSAPEVLAVALDLNMALASQCNKAIKIIDLTRDSELFPLALAYTNSNGRNSNYATALANIRCSDTYAGFKEALAGSKEE